MNFLLSWAVRALLAVAAGFIVYKVYDVFASAFRERKEFREKYEATTKDLGERTTERDNARAAIERQAAAIAAELKARDEAAVANAKRAADIAGKLKHAQRKLAEWEASAEPELARCLRLPLPDWLLDGTDEAEPTPVAPGLAAVLPRQAGPDTARTRGDAER